MKDKLPKGWEWKKLREVSNKINAGGDKPSAFSEFSTNKYKIPVISNGIKNDGIFGYTDKATIFEDCITVSARGTIGYPFIRKKPFLPIVRLISVIPNDLISVEYLYYSLVYILPKGEGSSIPQLTVPNLKEKAIILPLKSEQKQIVSVLDKTFEKLDQAIALVKENIQKLKQLNESVLDEVYRNLDKEKVKLVSVCEFEPKKAEVKNLFDLDCSFAPMAILNERKISFYPKEIKKISEVYKGYTYFRDNDVLLAKVTPCFENGKSGVAKNLVNGIGFGSSEYYVFRPSEKILSQFIYYFISRESFLIDGAKNMSGAVGLKRVTKTFIENIEISLPSIPEQQRIVAYLDQTTDKNQKLTQHYQNKLEALKRLKNSVLDSAFKGGLRREKVNKKRNVPFYQMQLIGLSVEANKSDNIAQGEMAIAKDMYLLDRLYNVPTQMNFINHSWGPFEPEIKKLITNKQYFGKQNYPNSEATYVITQNEEDLFKTVSSELKTQIYNGVSNLNEKVFSKLSPYKRAEIKELLATALKCIEDTQSTELATIREAMHNWKIKQDNFKTKAEKFSEKDTILIIKFIIKENWHLKVLK